MLPRSLLRLFNASCPGDARLPLGNRSVCRARDMPASKVVTCRPDPTYRAQRMIHHQEFNPRDEDPATVASFFRAPNDRLLSAYHFGLHAWGLSSIERKALEAAVDSPAAFRAGQESEIPNFKGSYLGRFPLVSADFGTSDHLSERSRRVDAFSGTRARGTLTLKLR